MDIIKKLKSALGNSGLQEDEILFYINVLKKPGNSIYDTGKKSNLPKDRAYKVAESLETKGLISRNHQGLQANSLDSFTESLYSKGRQFYHTADSLKEVKPFIRYLSLPEDETVIQTFSSDQMGENRVDLSYMIWETVLAYGNFELMVETMGGHPDREFMSRRVKRGKKAFPIFSRIGEYTKDQILARDNQELRQSKVLRTKQLQDTWITLLPDQDTLSVWLKDKKGIIKGATIKNPLICKLHEDLFNHFDEIAETSNNPNATPNFLEK